MVMIEPGFERRPLRGWFPSCSTCKRTPRTCELMMGGKYTFVTLQVCDSCADAIIQSAREEES